MNIDSCIIVSSMEKRLVLHQENDMFVKDQNLCQAGKKTLSAQFQEEESKSREPVRGIEGKTSGTDESLFGNFIKSRQENSAFQEMLVDELSSSGNANNVKRVGGRKSPPDPLLMESKSSHHQSTSSKLCRDQSTDKGTSKKLAHQYHGVTPPPLSPSGVRPKQRKPDSSSKESPPNAPVSSPNKRGTGSKRRTSETGLGNAGSCHSLQNSYQLRSPRIPKKSTTDLKSPISSLSKHSSHHQSRLPRSPMIRTPQGVLGKSPKVTTAIIRQEMSQALKPFPDLHIGDSSNHRTPRSSPSARIGKKIPDDQKRFPQLDVAEAIPPVTVQSSRMSGKEDDLDAYLIGSKRSPDRKTKTNEEEVLSIDVYSMPPLLDDTIQRDSLGGVRGGTQWSILEDTPGGHAPEKLAIISAVEYSSDDDDDDEEFGCKDGQDESMDEDDDIVDEDNYTLHDDSEDERPDRRQSLPQDPTSIQALTLLMQSPTIRPVDRFNPGFHNSHMWSTNVDYTSPLDGSGDFSLLSDNGEDHENVKERDEIVHDEHTLTNNLTDISSSGRTYMSGFVDRTKTPATTKQRGDYRSDSSPVAIPQPQQVDNKEIAFVQEENKWLCPDAVLEDASLNEEDGKRGWSASSSSAIAKQSSHLKSGSSNSGSSSRRQDLKGVHAPRPPARRRCKRNNIPEVVRGVASADLSPIGRSPLSSSLTSTPNSYSIASSGRQGAAMHTLRMHAPRIRPNKPLTLHVGRESSHSQLESDDYTLGASTITTNFSTTQRTFGDNTVSTRSLFQSQRMSQVDSLITPPLRRGEVSDEDNNTVDPLAPSSSCNLVNNSSGATLWSLSTAPAHDGGKCSSSLDNTFDRFRNESTRPNKKSQPLQTVLRRSSGDLDDLLDTANSVDDQRSDSCTSTESQGAGRDRKDHTDLVQLVAEINGVSGANVGRSGIVQRNQTIPIILMKESTESHLRHSDGEKDAGDGSGRIAQVQKSKVDDPFLRGASDHIPRSIVEGGKIKKKKSRRGLFGRVTSWKGVAVLPDDDDDGGGLK
jgi:hypothetical protein